MCPLANGTVIQVSHTDDRALLGICGLALACFAPTPLSTYWDQDLEFTISQAPEYNFEPNGAFKLL